MTKKIAISIPDDVAERLAAGDIDNVSAYVTEAVRRRIAVEHTRTALRDAGFAITDAGVDRWRQELADRGARTTPGMWQDLRDRIDRIAAGDELQ
jgi:hypothetical protein